MMLPQTPGKVCALGGTFSHRSGLATKRQFRARSQEDVDPQDERVPYLNS